MQTWPKSLDQLPPRLEYDIRRGHTYLFFKGEPQYSFGYGLSYTTFAHANLRRDGEVARVDVTNTGNRAGDEVVQLYLHRPDVDPAVQPRTRLIGFQRVTVAPGETKTVELPVTADELRDWNPQQNAWAPITGRMLLRIATSAAESDVKLELPLARE